jgi:hypothetical protein
MTRRPRRAGEQRRQLALRLNPLVAFYEVTLAEAQELLITWRHPLHLPTEQYPNGRPYTRPFGHMAFVMEDGGRRAAVVVLASTVNASVSKKHGFSELRIPPAGIRQLGDVWEKCTWRRDLCGIPSACQRIINRRPCAIHCLWNMSTSVMWEGVRKPKYGARADSLTVGSRRPVRPKPHGRTCGRI